MVCYRHPPRNPPFTAEALSSMMSDPSVLCEKGGMHTSMMLISIFAIMLVPVPFLGLASYATWKHPEMMLAGSPWLHAVRFLFFRIRGPKYYFGVCLLFRSLV